MKTWAMGGAAVMFCAALATWLIETVFAADGIDLGIHGTLAVFLCLVFVPGLTIGLMRLAHLSDTRGFDRAASEVPEPQPRNRGNIGG